MLIFIFVLLITFLYLLFKTKNNLHMFQQNFYNENNRYLKWLGKNKKVFISELYPKIKNKREDRRTKRI